MLFYLRTYYPSSMPPFVSRYRALHKLLVHIKDIIGASVKKVFVLLPPVTKQAHDRSIKPNAAGEGVAKLPTKKYVLYGPATQMTSRRDSLDLMKFDVVISTLEDASIP